MARRSNKMDKLEARLKGANKRAREAGATGMNEAGGALAAGALAAELEIRDIRIPIVPVPNSLAIAAGFWGAQMVLKPGKKMKQFLSGATLGSLGLYGYGLRRELKDSDHTIAYVGDFESEG
jgi:hypothetical protein